MVFLLDTVGALVVGPWQSGTAGVDTGSTWRHEMLFLVEKLVRDAPEDDG